MSPLMFYFVVDLLWTKRLSEKHWCKIHRNEFYIKHWHYTGSLASFQKVNSLKVSTHIYLKRNLKPCQTSLCICDTF